MVPKIPSDIYENRCRYCRHFCQDGENRDYDSRELFSYNVKLPCRVFGISGHCYQINADGVNRPYEDGECRSFEPNTSFPGICNSCKYFNHFVDGFCVREKAEDYRYAVRGNTHGNEVYERRFWTCKNWAISDFSKDCYLRDVVDGLAPPILDPRTFKIVSPHKGVEVETHWAELRSEKLAEIERQEQLRQQSKGPEQLRLDF